MVTRPQSPKKSQLRSNTKRRRRSYTIEALPCEILEALRILVIDSDAELLNSLEVVVDDEPIEPHGVQIVLDYVCAANLLPVSVLRPPAPTTQQTKPIQSKQTNSQWG